MLVFSKVANHDRSICPLCSARIPEPASPAAEAPCPTCGHATWFYLISASSETLVLELKVSESIRKANEGVELPVSLEAVCEAALAGEAFEAVLAAARDIAGPLPQALALALAGRAAASAGRAVPAGSAVREALEAADRALEPDWDTLARVLAVAAEAAVGIPDVLLVGEVIRRIPVTLAGFPHSHSVVASVLTVAAKAAAENGQLPALRDAARELPDPRSRDAVALVVAGVAAGAGLIDFALEAARGIGDASTRMKANAAVAEAAARVGRFEFALERALEIGPRTSRATCLSIVACAAARGGRFDLALAAAAKINLPLDRARTLSRVGEEAVQAGQPQAVNAVVEAVLRIASGLSTSGTRAEILARVIGQAETIGRAGEVKAAASGIETAFDGEYQASKSAAEERRFAPMAAVEADVSRQIREFSDRLAGRNLQELVVDLRQVHTLTRELYALLLALNARIGPAGRFRLREVRQAPLEVLRVMGWETEFEFEFLAPGQPPSLGRSVTAMPTRSPPGETAIDAALEAVVAGEGPTSDLDPAILRIESLVIGLLGIPSGSLVVCDPDHSSTEAFSRQAPQGTFPVRLFIVHYEGAGDQRIAAASLEFDEGAPDHWEQADIVFGVDSGTACIMDRTTAERFNTIREHDPDFRDFLFDPMDQHSVPTWSWALIRIPPDSTPGLACFSAGLGDGVYASYWGLRDGRVSRLVTDFGLIQS